MDTRELLLTACDCPQPFSVCLWDHATANVVHQYKNGAVASPHSLAVLRDDYIITAGARKPVLNAWTLNGHDPTTEARLVLPRSASCLAVCPSSVYLAAGIGRKLHVWHIGSGKLLTVQQKHYQPISVIKFSNDGTYLCVGGEDGGLVTYNFPQLLGFQSETESAEPLYSKSDHNRPITGLHVGIFGGGARLTTVSVDQACFVYGLATGDVLLSLVFPERLSALAVSDTAWSMFVGTYGGDIYRIRLTEGPQGRERRNVERSSELMFAGHKEKVTCLAVSFDGSMLVSGSTDCMVHVWQMRSRKVLKSMEHKGAVTDVLFVLNHDNFYVHSYRPRTVISMLEMTFEPKEQSLDVRVNQDYELEVDEEWLEEEKGAALVRENRYLRAANKQLYDASMMAVSKRLKLK